MVWCDVVKKTLGVVAIRNQVWFACQLLVWFAMVLARSIGGLLGCLGRRVLSTLTMTLSLSLSLSNTYLLKSSRTWY